MATKQIVLTDPQTGAEFLAYDSTNKILIGIDEFGTQTNLMTGTTYSDIQFGVATAGAGSTGTTITVSSSNVKSTSVIQLTGNGSYTPYYSNIVDNTSFKINGLNTGATSTSWLVIN